jgi:hypothetical protein
VRIRKDLDSFDRLEEKVGVDGAAMRLAQPADPRPEKTLILGWNGRGVAIVNELDNYVAPGSRLSVVASVPGLRELIEGDCTGLKNQTVSAVEADTTDRRILDSLKLPTYDQIILLCYSDTMSAQEADARTLMTLLHLRDIADRGGHDFRVVSEMLDVRNRELAEVTQADDFIVSNKLTSLMLAQVSENRELNARVHRSVRSGRFGDLFEERRLLRRAGPRSELLHRGRRRQPPQRGGLGLPASRRRRRCGQGLRRGGQSAEVEAGGFFRPRLGDRAGGGVTEAHSHSRL